MFSCEFCKISKNPFFTEQKRWKIKYFLLVKIQNEFTWHILLINFRSSFEQLWYIFFQFDFLLNPRNIECKLITGKGTDQEIESKKYTFLLVLDGDGRIHAF